MSYASVSCELCEDKVVSRIQLLWNTGSSRPDLAPWQTEQGSLFCGEAPWQPVSCHPRPHPEFIIHFSFWFLQALQMCYFFVLFSRDIIKSFVRFFTTHFVKGKYRPWTSMVGSWPFSLLQIGKPMWKFHISYRYSVQIRKYSKIPKYLFFVGISKSCPPPLQILKKCDTFFFQTGIWRYLSMDLNFRSLKQGP